MPKYKLRLYNLKNGLLATFKVKGCEHVQHLNEDLGESGGYKSTLETETLESIRKRPPCRARRKN